MNIVINASPRTKKNHSRIFTTKNGRRFIKPSAQYEQFEVECGIWLREYAGLNIDYPINLKCIFYKEKNYKSDLVGYIQAIQDVLVHYKVIADDNDKIVLSLDGSKCLVDRENPRIELEITKI